MKSFVSNKNYFQTNKENFMKKCIMLFGSLFLISYLGYGQQDLKPQVTAESGDFYGDSACYGMVLTSPSGVCYRIKVADDGTLITEQVACQSTSLGCTGCTDPAACNYDATANVDDGSCIDLEITIEWEKNFGGTSFDGFENTTDTRMEVVLANDDGFLVAGKSRSDDEDLIFTDGVNGGYDWWLIKTDNQGNLEWEKNFGGSGDDRLTQIVQAVDGGYILGGWSQSLDGDFDINEGGQDKWLIKIDDSGGIVWKKNYGKSGTDLLYALETSQENGYIFGSQIRSTQGVTLVDANGQVLNEGLYYSIVGLGTIFSIELTNDGGYLIGVRTFTSSSSFDYQVIKVSQDLTYEWHSTFGGSGKDWFKIARQTPDGGYLLAGWTESTDGDVSQNDNRDVWLVKINSIGEMEWEKSYGGSNQDYLEDCLIASDGIILGCWTGGDYWLVKLDFDGNIIWENTFGGNVSDRLLSIKQINDNEFILAGASNGAGGDIANNYGAYDYWLVKTIIGCNP